MRQLPCPRIYPAQGIALVPTALYKAVRMSANQTKSAGLETANRDRLLRRVIGCFAAAAVVALGMAVSMAVWSQVDGKAAPVSLAQDSPQ
jgi:hypothetical protein